MGQRRAALCRRWLDAILAAYGKDAAAVWRRERDPFTNPVGHCFATEAPKLVDAVVGDELPAAAAGALDAIVRIRAIQDLPPLRAVGFVWLLRDVVRAELAVEIGRGGLDDELAVLDRRVERLGLLAFDVYVRCRERVYQVRQEELKRSVGSLLRRWHGGGLPEPVPTVVALPILSSDGDR
jgi:hypothetical protein